jgi:YD repeat-containing protein
MTAKISLIIGVAAAALAFGVPTALGEGRLAGSVDPQGDFWNYDANGAKIADTSPGVSTEELARLYGGGQPLVSRPDSHDIVRQEVTGYIDAAARAQRIDVVVPTAFSDAHERSAPPQGSEPVATVGTGSGSDLEWPQLGIGFGLGLLLAVGLFLAMRMTKVRPLAH